MIVFDYRNLKLSLLALSFTAPAVADDERAFFEQRVQPILRKRCYECHSHEASELQGSLTLDSRSGWVKGGDSGPTVVPGQPAESLLIKAVRRTTKELQMPPDTALPDDEVQLLIEWIRRGAVDPRESPDSERGGAAWAEKLDERRKHWCWQQVVRPNVPEVNQRDWPLNSIDRFLLARIEAAGLVPSRDADLWTLARRLSVVLTGMTPEPSEVAAFVGDPLPDAVEKLVDRWLASPQFGEQWARHWMDLIRYSDSHGSEHDPLIPHAWRYRDYLVRAFNGNVPYDRVVREHLAGERLPPRWNPTLGINESPIGTGWFRFVEFYPTPIDVKNEEIVVLDAQIDSFGKTFQGLTLACARCHDHKFDAISARDFAALYGLFASSRVTMHRVSDSAAQHALDQQLIELKRPIRNSLAGLWREQLTHWRTAIPAARDKLHEPDPPKPADGKPATPMTPPFAPGTRSPEAEAFRWLIALKVVKDKPTEPLHGITRLVGQVSNLPAIDAKTLADLTNTCHAFDEQRLAATSRFRWFADFGNLEIQSGADALNSKEWFATDNFQQINTAGEFALSPSGSGLITAIYPLGRYSHLVSNKHGGTLRSPNFALDMKFISVLAGGTNNARVRLIIENFPSDQLLFAQAMPSVNEPRLRWITIPIREVWASRRAYLDIGPRDEMPYPGKMPDASKLTTDGRSGVGVRAVVFHDQSGAPGLRSPLPSEMWDVKPNWPAFVERLRSLADDAIKAWADERCTEEQSRFIDELLRVGVLLNEAPAEHELASLIAQYR